MKKVLSFLLSVVLVLLLALPTTHSLIVNAEGSYVEKLVNLGIVQGYSSTGTLSDNLALAGDITRAEFCKMIVLSTGRTYSKIKNTKTFTDLTAQHWAFNYIQRAAYMDIVNGYEDGTFQPEQNVTYEEAVKMTMSAFGKKASSYPLDYIISAQKDGYIDNVDAVVGENALRGEIMKMLGNVIAIEMPDLTSADVQRVRENIENVTDESKIPDDVDDITGTDYQAAVTALADLGIVDYTAGKSFNPDENISKAEFVNWMVKFRGRGSAISTSGTTTFFADSDLRPGGQFEWAVGAINLAYSLGIVSGDAQYFYPGAEITFAEAVKMVVCAIGYQPMAEQRGGYPTGYLVVASQTQMLDGIQAVSGQPVKRGVAAMLLNNTLAVDLMQQTGYGRDTQYEIAENHTVLSEYLTSNDSSVSSAATAPPSGVEYDGKSRSNYNTGAAGSAMGGVAVQPPRPQATSAPMYYAPQLGGGGGADLTYFPADESEIIYQGHNTEEFNVESENIFKDAKTSPLSTFSVDVDTASYSNMRRYLTRGTLPPRGAVRVEELINYFDYDYKNPGVEDTVYQSVYENVYSRSVVHDTDGKAAPFSVTTEISSCPWNTDRQLAMIGIKAKELQEMPPSNLVFLIDTSGSMNSYNKLPLVKKAMEMLTEKLTAQDKVSIVVYAGSAGLILENAAGNQTEQIITALNSLSAGGSTAGGAGIELAYSVASKNFIQGGNNRVILCTDGDFNVGASTVTDLDELITEKRQTGVFLSVLGFGMDNYKDNKMETLAHKGNGNYFYIDTEKEAKKVLVDEMTSTIFTIAKDVKIQVEFNPAQVKEYRLVGYESRKLANEDFSNDQKDAGDLGAGHTVTVFYEIIPANSLETLTNVDQLKYQSTIDSVSQELFTVKLRYKQPDQDVSKLMERIVTPDEINDWASYDFRFAAAVAQFGMLLNNSEYKGTACYDSVVDQVLFAKGNDPFGLKAEFIQLVGMARFLDNK